MKNILLFLVACLLVSTTFSQTIYTFTGNGLWRNATNWNNNTRPPSTLPSGSTIYISPATGDSCVLDTMQNITLGANLIVSSNAKFIVRKELIINNSTLPIITTDSVFSITESHAKAAGRLNSYGSDTLLAEGFVWDTLPYPTTAASTKLDLATGTPLGAFNGRANNLLSGRTYYLRSYATNYFGTAYGSEKNFTVKQRPDVLNTDSATNITSTSAQLNGYLSNGPYVGAIEKGFSITEVNTYGDASLDISSPFINQTDTGSINFSAVVSLQPSTIYFYAARVLDSDSLTSFGLGYTFTTPPTTPVTVTTQPITSIGSSSAASGGSVAGNPGSYIAQEGVVYATYPNPTMLNNTFLSNDGPGANSYTDYVTGLNASTTYYARAYILTAGNVVYYGNQLSFTTASPYITTGGPYYISNNSIEVGGYIASGNYTIYNRGIAYSSSSTSPGFSDSTTTFVYDPSFNPISGSGGTGSYDVNLSSLSANTTYYCRAFALTGSGIGIIFGNVLPIKTSQ